MKQQNIHDWFSQTAEKFSDREAIVYGRKSLSYRELEAKSNSLANFLLTSGAQKSDLVAILTDDVAQAITAILGILKAGCAFVPLDPQIPDKRLELMVQEVSPQWFLIETKFAEKLANFAANPQLRANVIAFDEEHNYFNPQRPPGQSHEDDLAYIFFTSGSTGNPKGIAGRLKGIDHFIRWEIETLGVGPETRVSQLLNLTFDGSLRDIFVPLCAGGTVCVPESKDTILDAAKLVDWIDTQRINIIHCVPSMFRSLLNEGLNPDLFPSLTHVLMAGEPLLPSDVKRWMDIFGERISLINLYGTSETTMAKFIHFVTAEDQDRPSVPVGQPMPGARALIFDESGKACPPGVIGEIHIRTPYRSLGYYNRPELTAQVFVQNPFSKDPQDVIYKTGDLGRVLKDGNFEFIGRKDQQVKVRGVRVELGEIENLLHQHPAVDDVAVVDYEDPSNNKYLCAFVVLNTGIELGELRSLLAAQLPEYMLPSVFLLMEKLPRTISGKINRRALPPPMGAAGRNGDWKAPRTPVEEVFEGIWARVLGVKRVSIDDNFFHLGGHSLMATQIVSRIRNIFQVELPLQSLFDTPTIEGLAEKVEVAMKAGTVGYPGPIEPVSRDAELPLSFAQQRLWFIHQLEPASAAYNVNSPLHLKGMLKVPVLEQTLAEIQRRHESLRTTFHALDGRPSQLVAPVQRVPLTYIDLSAWPESERALNARRLLKRAAMQSFDLARGPLWRTILLRVSEDEHLVLLTMHHAISDGWSMGVLVQEVATIYRAFADGQPSPLPDLSIQYPDFAHWQRRWFQGEALEAQLDYWKRQLAGSQQSLELPTDRPRPALQSFRGGYQYLMLPKALSDSLKELSRREGVTLFMMLVAAFKALLYRYTGQEDISIGTPIANRSRHEMEGLIGFFINTLVLRTTVAGDLRFRELLSQVREVLLGAYAHQELPFEKLVEELQPNRDLSRTPFFQVMLVLQNAPRSILELPGLNLTSIKIESESTKFDLTLEMEDTEQGLAGKIEYNTDLFDTTTIRRLFTHLQNLLESIVTNPDEQVSSLQMLSETEQQEALTWNDTGASYAHDSCIHQLFEAHVMQKPDAVAVVLGDTQLTYRELNRRANSLAHHLQSLGVGPESRVGICVARSLEMICGLLGIFKAGGAYVPLDPAYAKERLAFMIEDADLSVILTQEKLRAELPSHRARVVCVDQLDEAIANAADNNPLSGVTPQNLAYVIYTSGSTGKPKGVQIEHRGLCNLSDAQVAAFELQPENHVLQFASLSFDASIFEIVMALRNGATLHLLDQEALLPGPDLAELLSAQAITNIVVPPSLLAALPEHELPDLQTVIVAGEACSAELVSRWAPNRRFFNAYGPTETTVWATVEECFDGTGKPSIGGPIHNVQTFILDAQQSNLPVGVHGELHVGGAGLARGYLNRPDLTAEKFIPNPFSSQAGARLYKTGDLTRRLPDGRIDFLGRIDYQVKVRGFRIEPGEIETVLAAHPAVREAVVTAGQDASGNVNLIAYVVGAADQSLTIGQLRDYLRENLTEFMIPSAFVLLDALPRNPSGKVDRKALPSRGEFRPDLEAQYVAPRTDVEQTIAAIWQELLRLDQVGIHDNFFDLGGHSLLIVQVHSKLQATFKRTLSLIDLFKYPTISALADFLTQTETESLAIASLAHQDQRLEAGKHRLQHQLKLNRQAASAMAERIG